MHSWFLAFLRDRDFLVEGRRRAGIVGEPGESHAIAVAKRLGLGKDVVASARRHLDSTGKQFRRAIRATGQARQVAEEARAQAQQAELAAGSAARSLARTASDIQKRLSPSLL